MNHRNYEAAKVLVEQLLEFCARGRVFDFDSPHLTNKSLHPAGELALKFVTIHHEHHRRAREVLSVVQDEPRRCDECECLARTLRVPHKAGLLFRIGTTLHDFYRSARLVLAQNRFLQLIILEEKQNPLFQHH